MATASVDLVPPLRCASRQLVRELGFMRKTLAGTHLSPAAVHCLVEIGDHRVNHPPALSQALMLGEDEFQDVLDELTLHGEIQTESVVGPDGAGARPAALDLTPKGMATLSAVTSMAVRQVSDALDTVPPQDRASITQAIQLYASALAACRDQVLPAGAVPGSSAPLRRGLYNHSPAQPPPATPITLRTGYRHGLLGRTLELHLRYYSHAFDFGLSFETDLARGFADLLDRLTSSPLNQAWAAVETLPDGEERIVGTIFIDGQDLGEAGKAHLRGFIVDERVRGRGVGRQLLEAAMAFVDARPFTETILLTIAGLDAAIYLYQREGFTLEKDVQMSKWGQFVRVLEYVRAKPKMSLHRNEGV